MKTKGLACGPACRARGPAVRRAHELGVGRCSRGSPIEPPGPARRGGSSHTRDRRGRQSAGWSARWWQAGTAGCGLGSGPGRPGSARTAGPPRPAAGAWGSSGAGQEPRVGKNKRDRTPRPSLASPLASNSRWPRPAAALRSEDGSGMRSVATALSVPAVRAVQSGSEGRTVGLGSTWGVVTCTDCTVTELRPWPADRAGSQGPGRVGLLDGGVLWCPRVTQ